MRFRLFGSVEAEHNGQVLDIGPAQQRCVLTVLLIEANQVVSVDQLLERVWAERVPQRGRQTLYTYVSRLRGVLPTGVDVRLVRRSGGYVLMIDPFSVDLHEFHQLLAQARVAEDDNAAPLFERALGLCRGPAFATLDTPWLSATRDVVERRRIAATLDRNDVQLRRGQHRLLLPELSALAAANPLDERVTGQLMLALYRSGQQAEALLTYHRLSDRLAEELGVDPGEDLRRLHTGIIRNDPDLAPPSPDGTGPGRSRLAPSPVAAVVRA